MNYFCNHNWRIGVWKFLRGEACAKGIYVYSVEFLWWAEAYQWTIINIALCKNNVVAGIFRRICPECAGADLSILDCLHEVKISLPWFGISSCQDIHYLFSWLEFTDFDTWLTILYIGQDSSSSDYGMRDHGLFLYRTRRVYSQPDFYVNRM